MPLYTGLIVGGGAAALISKIEECLALSPTYWEFVEQVTVSSFDYRVWKNKGHAWAGNSEFFMYFQGASDSNTLYSRACEEWNPSTKKCTGLISPTLSGSATLDSLGRLPAADPARSSNGGIYLNGLPTSATTYRYYIAVGPQGLYVYTTIADAYGYMGLYEPSGVYDSGEFPLCAVQFQNSPQSKFSRRPGVTGSQSYTIFNISLANYASGVIPTGRVQLGNKSVLSRYKLFDTNNVYRGLAPAWMLVSVAPSTGIVAGDTITIGGVTYTFCNNSYGYNWIASNA